jgi:hypothetical protein
MALKRMDFPTLARPTMPERRLMLIRAPRADENHHARQTWLQRQRMRSAEEPHCWCLVVVVVAAAAGVRVNPANEEPSTRDALEVVHGHTDRRIRLPHPQSQHLRRPPIGAHAETLVGELG